MRAPEKKSVKIMTLGGEPLKRGLEIKGLVALIEDLMKDICARTGLNWNRRMINSGSGSRL
jgi:hypothetical protein